MRDLHISSLELKVLNLKLFPIPNSKIACGAKGRFGERPHQASHVPRGLFLRHPNFRRRAASLRRVTRFYALKNLLCCMKCEIYPFET